MGNTCDSLAIYTPDTAGLLSISAAVISAAMSGSTIVMCPVGNQICMMGYQAA